LSIRLNHCVAGATTGGICTPKKLSQWVNNPSIRNLAGRTLLDVQYTFYNSTVVGSYQIQLISGEDAWLCADQSYTFDYLVTLVLQS
jgi:hypothetical protein